MMTIFCTREATFRAILLSCYIYQQYILFALDYNVKIIDVFIFRVKSLVDTLHGYPDF